MLQFLPCIQYFYELAQMTGKLKYDIIAISNEQKNAYCIINKE